MASNRPLQIGFVSHNRFSAPGEQALEIGFVSHDGPLLR